MNADIQKYLYDILESVDSIEKYIGNVKDFNVYKNNKMLRRAVEREFEIIGEAVSRIEKIDKLINLSSKQRIISMRNRVIHGYDKVDDEIVWGTIFRHFPLLMQEVIELLKIKI